MNHKMIGCSEECLELACCDFCKYAQHDNVVDYVEGGVYWGAPIGCMLHLDMWHQYIAIGNSYCLDFHCFRADEDNMVVKEIDDIELPED